MWLAFEWQGNGAKWKFRSAPVAVLTTRMMNEGLLEDRLEKKKHPRRFYALTAKGRQAATEIMR